MKKSTLGLMALALMAPLAMGTSPSMESTERKWVVSKTPLTKKQIRARKASKLARAARKVSRPTY